jgi:glyoxylase-like metal-dependent hydrolase (beta-lactamase superfamily II)
MSAQVHTLDLNFMGIPHVIASYLIKHKHGALLIESGPGSTIAGLLAGLKQYDLTVKDVTDVLLTHIHLDHAGAAGWLARQGAQIYVHPVGAPHLLNPEKLLASAQRIYGEMMDQLWGEFLPVPEDHLHILHDGDQIEIGNLKLVALDTPGHADHHLAYLFEDLCFTGDVGGVRLPNSNHLRVPMPPPELHLGKWRDSLKKLQAAHFTRIAPTHFGIFDDPAWHINSMLQAIDEVDEWMQQVLLADPPVEEINDRFLAWTRDRSKREGLPSDEIDAYEAANPSWMSAAGMQRYWRKYRANNP